MINNDLYEIEELQEIFDSVLDNKNIVKEYNLADEFRTVSILTNVEIKINGKYKYVKQDTGETKQEKNTLRTLITAENIEIIDDHLEFFLKINRSHVYALMKKLLLVVLNYEYAWLDTLTVEVSKKQFNKLTSKKPIEGINQDLKMLYKYQNFLYETFNYLDTNEYFVSYNEAPEILELYRLNKALINDLEQKQFIYFQESKYYKCCKPNKKEIENFLNQIIKTHNLKGYSGFPKEFKSKLLKPIPF
jgi:hypothetical protein